MCGKSLMKLLLLVLISTLLFACSENNRTVVVTFDGESCSARGPRVMSAGPLLVDLDKRAEGVVVVDLYLMDRGKTWPELVSYYESGGSFSLPPSWVKGISGRDVGGDLHDREYNLKAGDYGIVCLYMGLNDNATWPASGIEVRGALSN